jgi:hypothetical protein
MNILERECEGVGRIRPSQHREYYLNLLNVRTVMHVYMQHLRQETSKKRPLGKYRSRCMTLRLMLHNSMKAWTAVKCFRTIE